MPVASVNGTELFYVEVGEGLPCLTMDAVWAETTPPCTPGSIP